MTVRDGIRSGLRDGSRAGANPDVAVTGVTRDSTSGIYCPANAAEWTIVMAAAGIASGGPSLLWGCQEASGNLADSIGTFTGTVSGTPVTYQQAVTGWTRKGIAGANSGTGKISNNDAGLPDPAVTSMLSIGYVTVTAVPGAVNVLVGLVGTSNATGNVITPGPVSRAWSGPNASTAGGNPLGAVRPYGFIYDVTNNRAAGWTDQDILSVTRGPTVNRGLDTWYGFTGSHLYRVAFFGSAAELTNAQIRTLLQVLGWSPAW